MGALRWVLLSGVALAALLAWDVSRIPTPEESLNPAGIRQFKYLLKIGLAQVRLKAYLKGNSFYDGYFAGMRSVIPGYVPKPERTEDGLKMTDVVFDGVPVRIYAPGTRQRNGPAVVFIHGGGWVLSSVEGSDGLCRDTAKETNMVVVSVEYRLAPEHPYPAAIDDVFTAVKHLLEHGPDYDVDPTRVAVAGDSAGGNLAAAVSLRLRDAHVAPPVKLQVLIYPVTQALHFNLPSFMQNEHDVLLPRDIMIAFWLQYAQGHLGNMDVALANKHAPQDLQDELEFDLDPSLPEPSRNRKSHNETVWNSLKDVLLDPYFAPLMSEDLSGLPKAMVYTVVQDVLRDEGALYAKRLKQAGNQVEHYHNRGGFHALNSGGLPLMSLFQTDADVSNTKIRNFIKNNL